MDLFNNTNDNNFVDPGLEAVNNFERLMKIFPKEHPSGIHGIMLMCNHHLQNAIDILLYITECRQQKEEMNMKMCLSCTNITEIDLNILEENLKNFSPRCDNDKVKHEGGRFKNNKITMNTTRVIKLEAFADIPQRKLKGKASIIPSSTFLKSVYEDKNSQFVKIIDTPLT